MGSVVGQKEIRNIRFHTMNLLTMSPIAYRVRKIFWHNRWSGAVPHVFNRMERSNLQERHKTLYFGVWGRENFFTLTPSYAQSPKNREKSRCSTVLQLRWVISTWWDENKTLFVFSACYEIHWNWFCERKQTKNAKIRRGTFFGEGCFDSKEYLSNTTSKRCSRQMLQLRCSC